jgi:hypothetical protein
MVAYLILVLILKRILKAESFEPELKIIILFFFILLFCNACSTVYNTASCIIEDLAGKALLIKYDIYLLKKKAVSKL